MFMHPYVASFNRVAVETSFADMNCGTQWNGPANAFDREWRRSFKQKEVVLIKVLFVT